MSMVRKVVPVDYLDMDGIECWLEDQSRQGLAFVKFGSWFAHFRRGEPREVRYHAEPMGALPASMAKEQAHYSAQHGWLSVGQFGPDFKLYCALDPEAEDFHTDPVTQSYALDNLSKKLLRNGIISCVAMVLMAMLLACPALTSNFGPVWHLVEFSSPYLIALFLLNLAVVVNFLWRVRGIFRLRRRLQDGLPASHRGWRHTGLVRQSVSLLTVLAALCSIGSTICYFSGGSRWGCELAALDRPAPVLLLQELEGAPALIPDPFDYPGYEGPDRHNYVDYNRKLLARHYEVDQNYTAAETDERYSLDMDWYDLALPFLASPLLDDMFDYHTFDLKYVPDLYQVEELSAPGFDRLILARHSDPTYRSQMLFASAGNRVIYLRYTGDEDLRQHLDLIARVLTWDSGSL